MIHPNKGKSILRTSDPKPLASTSSCLAAAYRSFMFIEYAWWRWRTSCNPCATSFPTVCMPETQTSANIIRTTSSYIIQQQVRTATPGVVGEEKRVIIEWSTVDLAEYLLTTVERSRRNKLRTTGLAMTGDRVTQAYISTPGGVFK